MSDGEHREEDKKKSWESEEKEMGAEKKRQRRSKSSPLGSVGLPGCREHTHRHTNKHMHPTCSYWRKWMNVHTHAVHTLHILEHHIKAFIY